jgi:hypothetical protein
MEPASASLYLVQPEERGDAMGLVLVLGLVVVIGVVVSVYGADSRDPDERGWFAGPRGHDA